MPSRTLAFSLTGEWVEAIERRKAARLWPSMPSRALALRSTEKQVELCTGFDHEVIERRKAA